MKGLWGRVGAGLLGLLVWAGCEDGATRVGLDPDPSPERVHNDEDNRPVVKPPTDTQPSPVDLPGPDDDLPDLPDVVVEGPGPWPDVPVKDYSSDYGIGPIQSVGVDDAHNVWLLMGDRIGVLRPGDSAPTWSSGVGQAAGGFGQERAAMYSTVICGGTAGRAYVGYATYDLASPFRDSPTDPEFLRGDLDVVKLEADGKVTLETHLGKTTSNSGYDAIGIRNTNDWHYDEDRTVLTCTKVMKGRDRGEVYIGTNHGVSRIRGLVYNSHRHPVWDTDGTLKIGYSHALGIGQDGQVLIGNEWKLGVVTPPAALADWDNHEVAPYTLNTWNQTLGSLEDMDYWRGFQQTVDKVYYLASEQYGLWRMTPKKNGANEGDYQKVPGLPTDALTSLQATDDGSLFIGTMGHGLWRRAASGELTQVFEVSESQVQQLVYDPSVKPSMLYVLAGGRLTVLRGY